MRIRVQQNCLVRSISRLVHLMDGASTRYSITGMLFQVRDKKLTLVATDGRAMGIETIDDIDSDDCEFILDGKTAKLLANASPTVVKLMEIDIDGTNVTVRMWSGRNGVNEKVTIGSTIEGRFPKWEQVIPTSEPVGKIVASEHDLAILFAPQTGTRIVVNGSVQTGGHELTKSRACIEHTGSCDVLLDVERYALPWLDAESDRMITVNLRRDEPTTMIACGSILIAMPLATRK